MLKKELEQKLFEMGLENAILKGRWEGLIEDLTTARDSMNDEAHRLIGSVQQATLVIDRMKFGEVEEGGDEAEGEVDGAQ